MYKERASGRIKTGGADAYDLAMKYRDEEVKAYFEREGNEITRESYEDDVESLKRGEIIERALEKSCPASVAYCLSLMY
ncbi:hypothetical protein HMPREF1633_04515 [Tissierellia bacterium S5-A11]|nr:hypothetical protein HMPREF1633_04515 [Tissierellia bacterium S5-A11]